MLVEQHVAREWKIEDYILYEPNQVRPEEGKTIKGIYMDGSWKKSNSVGTMMLGGG